MRDENLIQALSECGGCACFNLRKAARSVTQVFDAAMQPSGLRSTQFPLLVNIAITREITISVLARRMVMERTTLTRNLQPLEKEGLVQSVPGEDRRTRTVTLTKKGLSVLKEALPYWQKAQAKVVRHLGAERFQRVLADLRVAESLHQAE